MTRARTLKTTIRARMASTGERYTAARRHVIAASAPRPAARPAPAYPGPMPTATANARLVTRSGHDFAHWFAVLEDFGARTKGHTASARHLHDAHGVPGWHAQEITVAWERATGLRAVNQRMDGAYEVSVSKVLPVDVPRAAAAVQASTARMAWTSALDAATRRALAGGLHGPAAKGLTDGSKGLKRCRFGIGASRVELVLNPRADGRTTAVVTQTKLADAAALEARRTMWRTALTALAAQLSPGRIK